MVDQSSNAAAESLIAPGRLALSLSYKGTAYHGWQSQNNDLPCIQDFLEAAISKVANEQVEVVCAGRTDKSVHASHQVVHFETTATRTAHSWVFGCNANLPKDISVSWVGAVSEDFHARFSAIRRRYHYLIYNYPVRPSSFFDDLTWCYDPLSETLMHEAAQTLVGYHDFTSFRAVGCQSKSPFRHLDFLNVRRFGHIVMIDVQGNAFLHHMVRNVAGVLMAIGANSKPVSWCRDVLEAKDRTKGGVTAQPHGLYLTDVHYPGAFGVCGSSGAPSIIQSMLQMAAYNDAKFLEAPWDLSRSTK